MIRPTGNQSRSPTSHRLPQSWSGLLEGDYDRAIADLSLALSVNQQLAVATLISYATQPGRVAQDGTDGNSPYSRALAETIRTPGLDIFQSFNQSVSW